MPPSPLPAGVVHAKLIVGMEIHIELATRRKMFSGAPNPAWTSNPEHEPSPNTLIDPTVLGLPGALPVMNKRAVELSMLVGMALGCSIAERTHWDRKSYFYPDLPKAYQISQYDQPLCYDGAVDVPALDEQGHINPDAPTHRVRIIRAHLEEDAGKLLHELPAEYGTMASTRSAVDWNRAGVPLLEVVSAPDLHTAEQAVSYGRLVRDICRWLGASHGVMQQGHMRFEPNINCHLQLEDGRTISTPIVEIKNLNSFRALREAIEHEHTQQPHRWAKDGLTMSPGSKRTRGWDEANSRTVEQRDKEDAHEYRYFPDPDLPPLVIDAQWRERVASDLVELPLQRMKRIMQRDGLGAREAGVLVTDRSTSEWTEAVVVAAVALGVPEPEAGKAAAQLTLQVALRLLSERQASETQGHETPDVPSLGVSPQQAAELVLMRTQGDLSAQGTSEVFEALATREHRDGQPRDVAQAMGLLTVRDESALEAWCAQAIAGDPATVEQIRAGNDKAVGRLMGAVMQLSGGAADAKAVRQRLLDMITASR